MNKKDSMSGHDLIVVGASTGGVEALPQLVGSRPRNLPASVFGVLHVSSQGPGYLPQPIKRHATLSVAHAVNGKAIRRGRVYVAPPYHDLQVDGSCVRLSRGPCEDFISRPLMCCFARLPNRMDHAVLTSHLDDGTAGLHAMKSLGGTGEAVKKKVLTVHEALRYVLSLPIAVLVSGMEKLEVLQQNLAIARNFTPMPPEEMRALRSRCATQAPDGRFELYKTSKRFDGPPGREQHSFPPPEKITD